MERELAKENEKGADSDAGEEIRENGVPEKTKWRSVTEEELPFASHAAAH